jgi:seryl-tRNA synthetase
MTITAVPEQELLAELIKHRLFIPTGVPGVFGRGRAFEDFIERFERVVSELAKDDGAEWARFPPVIPRADFERSEYLKSFPQLAGSVVSFDGDQKAHAALLEAVEKGADYREYLKMTNVAVAPAACYAVYPGCKGKLPEDGRLFDVQSWCFRHEPSSDPARLQIFRMREFVRVGDPEMVKTFRDRWIDRARELLHGLGLMAEPAPANDPFFGRGGKLLALDQRDRKLKYELLLPITSVEKPTALMSFNYHQEHFGHIFGIQLANGELAHTACVGFGLERLALAMFKTHGCVPAEWPAEVRKRLGL